MKKWAVVCEMLPDADGNRKIRMGSELYEFEEDALDYQRKVRNQNLPFRCWPIEVDLTGVPFEGKH